MHKKWVESPILVYIDGFPPYAREYHGTHLVLLQYIYIYMYIYIFPIAV